MRCRIARGAAQAACSQRSAAGVTAQISTSISLGGRTCDSTSHRQPRGIGHRQAHAAVGAAEAAAAAVPQEGHCDATLSCGRTALTSLSRTALRTGKRRALPAAAQLSFLLDLLACQQLDYNCRPAEYIRFSGETALRGQSAEISAVAGWLAPGGTLLQPKSGSSHFTALALQGPTRQAYR